MGVLKTFGSWKAGQVITVDVEHAAEYTTYAVYTDDDEDACNDLIPVDDNDASNKTIPLPLGSDTPPPVPTVSLLDKAHELICLALTRLQIVLLPTTSHLSHLLPLPLPSSIHTRPLTWTGALYRPLSAPGAFTTHYIEPMFQWWGLNTRILLSPSLGRVSASDAFLSVQTRCVNGASHNYAGFYQATERAAALHRLALDVLPVQLGDGLLRDAVHEALVRFWGVEMCVLTGTGYGSNYVGLPPLLAFLCAEGETDAERQGEGAVTVVCDEHCHNSIFAGVYVAMGRLGPGLIKLRKFAHNDAAQLEAILRDVQATRPGEQVLVVVEGLYSMEGDVPPLPALYKLKQTYAFTLYCDEAHSFLSLGRTGGGCVEYFTDRGIHVPADVIDIRTGTLSKAVGGIGGYIAASSRFAGCFAGIASAQPVSTATLVQTLLVLRQPCLIRRNLARLAATARVCRDELRRRGVFVYGSVGTPILPIWTGRACMAARCSYEMRRRSVLASPVTTPAVPFWESRVRVNLSADFDDADVAQLVDAVVVAARATGVLQGKRKATPPRDHGLRERDEVRRGGTTRRARDRETTDADMLESEAQRAFDSIRALILAQARQSQSLKPDLSRPRPHFLTAAGHASRQAYGVGAGSSRWISGTFPPHLATERRIASTTQIDAAMTFADAGIGLAATVAALARPVRGADRHVVLLPDGMEDASVEEGFYLVPPGGRRAMELEWYAGVEDLERRVGEGGKGTCFTVYIAVGKQARILVIRDLLARLVACQKTSTITVLIHDTRPPASSSSRPDLLRLGDMIPASRGRKQNHTNIHVLVFGTCACADVSVGYLAGPEALVRELRYTSRGYMYTTSTPPFVMNMVCAALDGDGVGSREGE